MISEQGNGHQKHVKLTKPDLGYFGRNEIAILGTPCGQIKKLVQAVIDILASDYRMAYIDADHASAREAPVIDPRSALGHGAVLESIDKIDFQRWDVLNHPNDYYKKAYYNDQDLILVNGNHFLAKSQVVVIDPKKPLEKKLEKLTDIKLFLLQKGVTDLPDYLKEHQSDWASIPVLAIENYRDISDHIRLWMETTKPSLKGLVLAGGKGIRMNQDKGLLNYHGQPQRDHVYDQLQPYCAQVFISCREDQLNDLHGRSTITDSFVELGPFGALLSAFRTDPNSAWLAVACDLPFLTDNSLKYLINNRNTSQIATTFKSPFDEFPEPLITIWEPRAYQSLLYFLALGYSCPRKVLINSNTEILEAPNGSELKNVNHPEEYQKALKDIKG